MSGEGAGLCRSALVMTCWPTLVRYYAVLRWLGMCMPRRVPRQTESPQRYGSRNRGDLRSYGTVMSMATDAETLPDRGEARLQLAEDAVAELLGAAVHAGGPGGSAAVLHGDGLDVPGGGLGLALDAVYLTGFGGSGHSWTLLGENGCRHCNPPRHLARPAAGAGILVTLAPYVPKGWIHRMALPLRAVRRTNCPRPRWTYQAGCAAGCIPYVRRCWSAGSAKVACWNSRAVMDHADVADSSWRSTS